MSSDGKKGITLVEVLFSAAIISLVLIGVLVVLVQTINISRRINYEYAATILAKSRIESAMAFVESSGFDALTQGNFGETEKRLDSDGVPADTGDFLRSTTVTTNYDGNPRLTGISVEVGYIYRGAEIDQPVNMATVLVDMIEE